MKYCFLLGILCVAGIMQASAQSALTRKFRKNVPVQMLYYERLYDPNNVQTSKNKLKKTKEFTPAEVEEIFVRLGLDAEIPAKLNNDNPETLQHYRMHEISNFSLMGWNFSLVYIPFDENRHMPKNMQPPTAEGSIFYTYTKHLSFNGRDASGNPLAKAGTPLSGGSDINFSVADMSQFTKGGNGSPNVVPQVFVSTADPQTAEKGKADYEALYARLPQIANEYEVLRKKVFAQVEEDRKTGIQSNLFMKKERAAGQQLLDEWHAGIDLFLKTYDPILTPEAKEEIGGWHKQALWYIDF